MQVCSLTLWTAGKTLRSCNQWSLYKLAVASQQAWDCNRRSLSVCQQYPLGCMLTFSATACCEATGHATYTRQDGTPERVPASDTSYMSRTFCRPGMSVKTAEANCTITSMSFAHRSDLCKTFAMVLGTQHGTSTLRTHDPSSSMSTIQNACSGRSCYRQAELLLLQQAGLQITQQAHLASSSDAVGSTA